MKTFTQTFDEHVLADVQRGLVGVARAAHEMANRFCYARWPAPEARDLEPYVCRACVERGLVLMEKKFPRRVRVNTIQNASGNSARRLECGNVWITASRLGPNDGRVPRFALYRNNLARDYNQYRLQPDDEQDRVLSIGGVDTIYGILCHRPSGDRFSLGKPSEVVVVFIDEDDGVIESIDLLARVAARRQERETEIIKDEVMTVLRHDITRLVEGA